jgi:hypothetical protein
MYLQIWQVYEFVSESWFAATLSHEIRLESIAGRGSFA